MMRARRVVSRFPFFAAALLVAAFCGGCAGIVGPAADPLPARPENGPFLFCYFLGNGDGLHLALSKDGFAFEPIGDRGTIFLKPAIGHNIDGSARDNHLMRDPCVRQGPDGMYRMVWTTGWLQRGFGAASSPDLVHWSEQQFVSVMEHEKEAANVWAPELFYDAKKAQWMVFWATTIPGRFAATDPTADGDYSNIQNRKIGLNHRIYYVTTRDFKTWSETKLLIDPGFNCIDATIAERPDGKFVMVLKDETRGPTPKKNLRVALADAPEGPWSAAGSPISPPDLWVEGPSVARVRGAWLVYYDAYRQREYGAMMTRDFESWENAPGNFSMPAGSRHGTVFPVTPAAVERLQQTAAEMAAGKKQ